MQKIWYLEQTENCGLRFLYFFYLKTNKIFSGGGRPIAGTCGWTNSSLGGCFDWFGSGAGFAPASQWAHISLGIFLQNPRRGFYYIILNFLKTEFLQKQGRSNIIGSGPSSSSSITNELEPRAKRMCRSTYMKH
jgi:hypothetical protein